MVEEFSKNSKEESCGFDGEGKREIELEMGPEEGANRNVTDIFMPPMEQ